jgi:hypothetical protein
MELRLVVSGILVLSAGMAQGQSSIVTARGTGAPAPASFGPMIAPTSRVPLDQVPAEVRERMQAVLERPTLRTHGPTEAFNCEPVFYLWLLDHPDLAVRLWRGLGVRCAEIQDRGAGRFGWQDGQGSNLVWSTVLNTAGQRVWYAEGHVKPGVLLPAAMVRAVVCMNHREGKDEDGRPAVRHQVELYLQTDSRAMALAARLLGASAPHLAEQYAGQIQTFYAALAWYCDQNPERAEMLMSDLQHSSHKSERTRNKTQGTEQ